LGNPPDLHHYFTSLNRAIQVCTKKHVAMTHAPLYVYTNHMDSLL